MKCNFCKKKCVSPFRRGLGSKCREFLRIIDKQIGTTLEEHYKNPGQSRRGLKFKGVKYLCKIKNCPQNAKWQGYCRTHHRKFTNYEQNYYSKRKKCIKCNKRPSFARRLCHCCYQVALRGGRIENYPMERYTYVLAEKERERLLMYIDAIEIHRKEILTFKEWHQYVMPGLDKRFSDRIYCRMKKIIGNRNLKELKRLVNLKVIYQKLRETRAKELIGNIHG